MRSFSWAAFPDKDSILKALIVGAFLSSLCAIMQFTIVYPALMDTFRHSKYASLVESQPIPFSSFLYHNIFGGYLAFIVPISLYFAVFEKKIFYSITTIIILIGLILTTTRIGIGLAVLSILASLIVLVKDRDVKSILHLLGLACAGLLIAVLADECSHKRRTEWCSAGNKTEDNQHPYTNKNAEYTDRNLESRSQGFCQ